MVAPEDGLRSWAVDRTHTFSTASSGTPRWCSWAPSRWSGRRTSPDPLHLVTVLRVPGDGSQGGVELETLTLQFEISEAELGREGSHRSIHAPGQSLDPAPRQSSAANQNRRSSQFITFITF